MRPTKNIQMGERAVQLLRAGRVFLDACGKLATRVWPLIQPGQSRARREAVAWGDRLKEEKDSLLCNTHPEARVGQHFCCLLTEGKLYPHHENALAMK